MKGYIGKLGGVFLYFRCSNPIYFVDCVYKMGINSGYMDNLNSSYMGNNINSLYVFISLDA